MSNAAPIASKPADTQIGQKPSGGGQSLENLLAAAEFGVFCKGLLMVIEPPKLNEGIGKESKKPFKFYNQRLQVFTGKNTVECTITKDKEEDFPRLAVGPVSFKVAKMRMYGGAPIFEVEV